MYNKIRGLVEEGKNLFITGGGGVGKSYILNKLKDEYPEMVVTATTGIAAVNVNGETIHKWSCARLFEDPISKVAAIIRKIPDAYQSIMNCEKLAIDEVSMLSSHQLDYLNELLQTVRKDGKPFGGIQLLLFGDLFQLPPIGKGNVVIIDGKKYKIDYCFKAKCWEKANFKTIYLKEVYRQKDKKFIEVLNSIREGNPKNLDLLLARNGLEAPEDATKLYTVNKKVEKCNKEMYSKIDAEETEYWAKDEFYKGKKVVNPWDKDSGLTDNQKRVFNDFNEKCKAEKCLKLKVGTRVMLLHNLDVYSGLCNGSCGYVTKLEPKTVTVKFDNGKEYDITKNIFQLRSNGKLMIQRVQIPLALAYSMTTHKAQGQTIDKLAIDFDQTFEKGQTYVALSRATNLETLYLNNFTEDTILVDQEIVKFYKSLEKV